MDIRAGLKDSHAYGKKEEKAGSTGSLIFMLTAPALGGLVDMIGKIIGYSVS